MSFFDGNARSPMSAGVSRVGAAQYDAGLRAYMLGIYNHMTLALAISFVITARRKRVVREVELALAS